MDKNQYQMPLDSNGSGDNQKHVESISDIEFNPEQKLTTDFLKSQSLPVSDGNSKSNDVNQAFLEIENEGTESNVNSFCGELAQ